MTQALYAHMNNKTIKKKRKHLPNDFWGDETFEKTLPIDLNIDIFLKQKF
jgi:hypothetical protein